MNSYDDGDFADLSELSPEQRQALLGLSSQDVRAEEVQRQLAQAKALGERQYHTAGGAALGGLAGILREQSGKMSQRDMMARQQAGIEARMALGNHHAHQWAEYPGQAQPSAAPLVDAGDMQPQPDSGPDSRAMQAQPQQAELAAALMRKKSSMPNPFDMGDGTDIPNPYDGLG